MKTFNEVSELLYEKVLSIGINPDHEKFREKHRQEIHDILRNSYSKVEGGYSGLGTGTDEESQAIHKDISDSVIKATRRDGRITSVSLYKKKFGRKSIASGTDGTPQGKEDFMKNKLEDYEQRRAWAEVSGAPEHIFKKIGYPTVPSSEAPRLLGKEVEPEEGGLYYKRRIGHEKHRKVIMGYPKDD